MAVASVLLPALRDLRGGLAAAPALARVLARADLPGIGEAGRDAQLLRHFEVLPRRLPAAPLSRLLDAGDAALNGWLRCDPAHVRADGTLLRLLAWGDRLQPSVDEVAALLAELRPLFGDFDAPLSAPSPGRWYAAIAHPEALPAMSPPAAAAGEDVLAHLPEGRAGARWRQLWNEAQVVLHQHPVNHARAARGLPTINSLWFWGGGRLPDSVRCGVPQVLGQGARLRALARLGGATMCVPDAVDWTRPVLLDLSHLRDIGDLDRVVWPELAQRLRRGDLQRIQLDFADGLRADISDRQRWRWWRRPWSSWPVAG